MRLILEKFTVSKWILGAISVALAVFFMNITKTVHPPGGACALIAIIGGRAIEHLGYYYVITSTLGALLMILVALLGNNIVPGRRYPTYWY